MKNFKHAAVKKACLQSKQSYNHFASVILAHLNWSVT